MNKHFYFAELNASAQERAVEKNKDLALDEHWYQDTIDTFGDLGAYVEDFQVEINPTYVNFKFEQEPYEIAENFLRDFPDCVHCANWLEFVETAPSQEDYDLAESLFKKDMEDFMLDIIQREYNELTEYGRVAEYLDDFGLLFDKEGNRIYED